MRVCNMKIMKTKTKSNQVLAAERIDWQQIMLNGGNACFHLDGQKFCLRAKRWLGHEPGSIHDFVSLADLLKSNEQKSA